jgi:hypothetical protein
VQVPRAWAALFPDICNVFAHAGCPEQLAWSWLHATSSSHAVSEAQQDAPRHFSQGPCTAISEQKVTGSG